jgi:2-octaprenyl-6-methoxyphenol hydroxylase
LNDALAEVVAGDRAIEIVAPDEIASFDVGTSTLDLAFAGRGAASASLLIAADGRNSPLRGMAGIKSVGRSYPQMGIVTTVAHAKPHNGHAVQHFLPGGPFAILPLPGNRACITWTEEAGEARRILALDDAEFLDEVDKRFGGKLGTISLAGPRQSWPLELHLARSYIAPRFSVVGDAAHVVHPIAGQGLNLALRDAAALTEAIIDAARLGLDLGSAQALERYERWRRFDAAMSTAAFDGLNVLFSNDSTLLRAARDVGLGLVDRSPMLKQLFVAEAAGITGDVPRLLRGEAV